MSAAPILVTGGAGYVGSVLVRRLLSKGCRVRVVDRMLFGARGLEELDYDANLEILVRDLRDPRAHGEALDGIETVVHLAAIAGEAACALEADVAVETNWIATVALARRARASGARRLVLASTCDVYGEDRDETLTEDSPVKPSTLYAELGSHAEQGVLELADGSGFEAVVLRLGAVYGLSPRMRFDLAINHFAQKAVREGEVSLSGGTRWRPFLHVEDAARGIVMGIDGQLPIRPARIFNLGDNLETYPLRNLKEELEAEVPGVRVTLLPEQEDHPAHRVCFDRIEREWGFRATRRIRDGIEEIVRAIRSGVIADPEDRRFHNA
ncbi:MAG TPA: SDR family oxidoreductase [Planctomycetota bacterium]|nr:SDR family oxidoreductase [Planctomycetota bacterium]